MTNHPEKRHTTRHSVRGPITLHPTILASKNIHADLLNFSEQGISFTASRPFIPGTTILFRASTDNYRQAKNEENCLLRSIGLVTIRWCQEGSDPNQGQSLHAMGAAYLLPY